MRHVAAPAGLVALNLGAGETEAILLAVECRASLILMDDRRGVAAARQYGLNVAGTMGLLARAAALNLLDLATAFDRLKRTNFRYKEELMNGILAESSSGNIPQGDE
jgi:predicted nucleic acid-binding protein